MKKLSITAAFLFFSGLVFSQQGGEQPNDDQLQQQAPRETQRQVERSAKVEAVKQQSNSEVDAERLAKEKSQTQKQTKAQPVGMNPEDTVAKPKSAKKPISR